MSIGGRGFEPPREFERAFTASLECASVFYANLLLKFHRKYPQFEQSEIFSLQDAFRKLDLDEKGYLDEATVIKATQQSERQPYDAVRQALKEVELDSSRRVELEDYVDVCVSIA